MTKLLAYFVPLVLIAAPASAAPPHGWGSMVVGNIGVATAADEDATLVLVMVRGGGAHVNRASVNRGNFNSNNFHRDVSANRNFSANRNVNVNRNVSVDRNVSVNRGYYGGGSYGPNWGGVAAGVAVGAGVTAMATSAAAASSTYYPPPPPYQYYSSYGY
jgi:hypothetical protein